ncbi:hypothetical protein BSLG_010503 [Batrachochytrium salamandrivorans]|nr:hypothetical protein BASA60_000303 [Batrachochytrium salamandrivorans]KAH9274858.1 hypothetical protein BASA83_002568 [Batrachochytrium salamandrivorans]KAJ1327161.1 hypothetical protein BSLG_010503 [Batrachochytrium salamandrivorans]
MADWHSNPLTGDRPSQHMPDAKDDGDSDKYDDDGDYTTTPISPLRVSTQPTSDGRASLTPLQLSEYVLSSSKSKIPPYEFYPKQICSSRKSLSTKVSLSKTLFTTGEAVSGRLEVTCSKEHAHTKIGKIHVYLIGIEETLSKVAKCNQRLFLSKRLLLQDVSRATTDAVYAGKPDENGMWKAKQGTTTFDFSISMQANVAASQWIQTEEAVSGPLPSSYWNRRFGGIRYIVAGIVYTKHGTKQCIPIAAYQDLNVVESSPFQLCTAFSSMLAPTSPLIKETSGTVKRNVFNIGKRGIAKLIASLRVPQVDSACDTGTWLSGGVGFVGIEIQNASTRTITEVSASLVRRVKTFSENQKTHRSNDDTMEVNNNGACSLNPLSFVRTTVATRTLKSTKIPFASGLTVQSSKFQGVGVADDSNMSTNRGRGVQGIEHWNGIAPDTSSSLVLDMNIPMSSRSIRYGLLVDVSFVVHVVITPKGRASIDLEIPITILHPASFYTRLPAAVLNIADVDPLTERLAQAANEAQAQAANEAQAQLDSEAETIPPQHPGAESFKRTNEATFVASSSLSLRTAPPLPSPISIVTGDSDPYEYSPTKESMYSAQDRYDRPLSRDDLIKSKTGTIGRGLTFCRPSITTTVSPTSIKYSHYSTTTPRSGTIGLNRGKYLSGNSPSYTIIPDSLNSIEIPTPSAMPPVLSVMKQTRMSVPSAGTPPLRTVRGPAPPPPPPPSPPPLSPSRKSQTIQRAPVSNDLNSANSLDGVPRMDLVQEIDKLFACVSVE